MFEVSFRCITVIFWHPRYWIVDSPSRTDLSVPSSNITSDWQVNTVLWLAQASEHPESSCKLLFSAFYASMESQMWWHLNFVQIYRVWYWVPALEVKVSIKHTLSFRKTHVVDASSWRMSDRFSFWISNPLLSFIRKRYEIKSQDQYKRRKSFEDTHNDDILCCWFLPKQIEPLNLYLHPESLRSMFWLPDFLRDTGIRQEGRMVLARSKQFR